MATEVLKPRHFDHDVHFGSTLLKDMRDRGWPVVGALWPRGVERGSLSWDSATGDWVWEHDETEEDLV